MDGLRISVLGPLRAWRGGRELDTGPAQRRAVLAALALRAGRVVTIQDLLEGIWEGDPPANAAGALRNHVYRLRTALENDPQRPEILVSSAGGYVLHLEGTALDAVRCEKLAAQAVHALGAGDSESAARLLGETLELWHGTPLTGVPGSYAERQRNRLIEIKLGLYEKQMSLALERGRHAEAAAQLSDLAAEHPLREGLRALQMLALYRSGRQGEALAAYDRTRRLLADELGIDPGTDLTRLHQRILRSDPGLLQAEERVAARPQNVAATRHAAPVDMMAPAQLPPDVPDFTGRNEAVVHLGRHLTHNAGSPRTAATVCVVHGMGGIGKTTVAVHAAHTAREHFPDGQLYVDLRGASREPADPKQIQESFLRALGIAPGNIPADPVERTALYRSRLAGRRVLIVLDNAVNADQVSPLLPGTADCATLITSRTPLSGLAVTSRTALEPFSEDEALALLERITSPARHAREPQAARSLVHACGLLPLAVRIAASRLAARPRWTIEALAARLTDNSRRLGELQAGGLAVEAAFELGYGSLSSAEARAFRVLAMPEVAELTPGCAASLLDTTEQKAEDVMESLATAGLLDAVDPGRYRFHDLLRLFARHRVLQTDPAAERQAALSRLASYHLAGMSAALRVVRPDSRLADAMDPGNPGGPRFTNRSGAQQWVITELPSILGVAGQIAHHPTRPISTDDVRSLGRTLMLLMPFAMPFNDLHVAWGSLAPLGHALLDKAKEDDYGPGVIAACAVLAVSYASTGEHTQAQDFARRGYMATQPDDRIVRHRIAYLRGTVTAMDANALDDAVTHFTEAAELCRALGEAAFEAQCLLGVGTTRLAQGNPGEALRYCRQALTLSQTAGGALNRVLALRNIGQSLHELGHYTDAIEHYTGALAFCDAEELPSQRAHTLLGLARAHFGAGRLADARSAADQALPKLALLGDSKGQRLATDLLSRIGAPEGFSPSP
ncbi:BTAD domain-containing putative transcriptional regulator [Streptomyces sp. NPDC059193]|uniref:AfsR/SARP family transcriptional regulator n=1 Tax=Streptomyces sp. NPDC059193 TaxID=3346763 RepID=UPI0036AF0808